MFPSLPCRSVAGSYSRGAVVVVRGHVYFHPRGNKVDATTVGSSYSPSESSSATSDSSPITTSTSSPSSAPAWSFPAACCVRYICAKKSGVLASTISLSSRSDMKRGNRRLRPLVWETSPRAATDTGLIVMLWYERLRKELYGVRDIHVLGTPYLPYLLGFKIHLRLKSYMRPRRYDLVPGGRRQRGDVCTPPVSHSGDHIGCGEHVSELSG